MNMQTCNSTDTKDMMRQRARSGQHGHLQPADGLGQRSWRILGAGRVAEEALAIAVCCALTAANFADGIILAANNSRNSSTTAAITGSLLGAQFGDGVIPTGWLNKLELETR